MVSLINGDADKSKLLTDICIMIILSAWILNMVISVTKTIRMIVVKIRSILAKRRLNKIEDIITTKGAPMQVENIFQRRISNKASVFIASS